MRTELTPTNPIGCKRVLLSNDWNPALTRASVEIVGDEAVRATTRGIVTADGVEGPVDMIIYRTGSRATESLVPMAITGTGGLNVNERLAGRRRCLPRLQGAVVGRASHTPTRAATSFAGRPAAPKIHVVVAALQCPRGGDQAAVATVAASRGDRPLARIGSRVMTRSKDREEDIGIHRLQARRPR